MGQNTMGHERSLLFSLISFSTKAHITQWKRISSGRPFLLKGIQSVDDARKALDLGCEGIVVSNHAGRQVDGAVGSLEILPDIVEAVGDSECLRLSD